MKTEIKYRVATEEDSAQVLELLHRYFFPDEPLINSLKSRESNVEYEMSLISYLNNGTCIVATSDHLIVGVSIAAPKESDEADKLRKEAVRYQGTKFSTMLLFDAALEEETKYVFEKYNVNRALQTRGLAVNSNFRGMGIGKTLYENSMANARRLGFRLYAVSCSSIYSARLCESLNMDCFHTYSFKSFRLPNSNDQVFFPLPDQQLNKFYAMKL